MANWLTAIPLANGFTLDVRVSHALITGGGMGIAGDHPIVVWIPFGQIAPIQADLKGTEINVIQFNRIDGHRNRLAAAIERDVLELLMQSNEVGINVTDCCLV